MGLEQDVPAPTPAAPSTAADAAAVIAEVKAMRKASIKQRKARLSGVPSLGAAPGGGDGAAGPVLAREGNLAVAEAWFTRAAQQVRSGHVAHSATWAC